MFDVEKRFTSLGRQVNGRNLALIKIGKGPAKLRVRNENLDFFLWNQDTFLDASTSNRILHIGLVEASKSLQFSHIPYFCSAAESKKAATNGSTTTQTAAAEEVQQTQRVSTPRSGPNSIFFCLHFENNH